MADSNADTINARIALQGAEEIIAQLKRLGDAGQQALKQIHDSSVSAGGDLNAIGEGAGGLGEALRPLITIFDEFERGESGAIFSTLASTMKDAALSAEGLTLAAGALTGVFFGLAKSAAEATNEIHDQAEVLGTTAQKWVGLQIAAVAAGASQDRFGGLMDRFTAAVGRARQTSEQLALQQKAAANEATIAGQKLAQSYEEGALAAKSFAIAQEEAALASKASDSAVSNVENSISDLQDRIAALTSRAFAPGVSQAAQDRIIDATRPQVEALERQISQLIDQRDQIEARANIARERQAEAEEKFALDEEKRQTEQLALINKQTQIDAKQATEIDRTQKMVVDFLAAGGTLGDATADMVDAFAKFADNFVAIPAKADQAALAMAVFGKGWAQAVDVLKQGGGTIREQVRTLQEFSGITEKTSEIDKKLSEEFLLASAKFETIVKGTKNAIGLQLGELFVPGLTSLAEFLRDSQPQIREWASSVIEVLKNFAAGAGDVLGPVFKTIGETVTSISGAIGKLNDAFKELFGETFSLSRIAGFVAFAGLLAKLSPTFALVTLAATAFDHSMTAIFGDAGIFNAGNVIAFGLALSGLVRVFGLLSTAVAGITLEAFLGAIGAATTAVETLVASIIAAGETLTVGLAAVGPGGWLILGLGALALGIGLAIQNFDKLKANVHQLWEGTLIPFGEFLTTSFSDALKGLGTALTDALTQIKTGIQQFQQGNQIGGSSSFLQAFISPLRGVGTLVATPLREATAAIGDFVANLLRQVPIVADAWAAIQRVIDPDVFLAPLKVIGEFLSGDFQGAFNTALDAIQKIVDRFFGGIEFSINGLVDWFKSIPDFLSGAFSTAFQVAVTGIQNAWLFVTTKIENAINGLIDWFDALWQKAKRVAADIASLGITALGRTLSDFGSTGNSANGNFAGGGFIRGPGTTTSDSILARVSNEEFITRAHAVRVIGADVFHELNRTPERFTRLREIITRGFPVFAQGGLINAAASALPSIAVKVAGAMIPDISPRLAFAAGGLVEPQMTGSGGAGSGQSRFTLVIGDQTVELSGQSADIDRLERQARQVQNNRTGRMPGWKS